MSWSDKNMTQRNETQMRVSGADTRPKNRAITDNVPEKITAHSVRYLVPCKSCGGFGDRRLMLSFTSLAVESETGIDYHHTSCYAKANPSTLHTIGQSNIARLRLCDFHYLTKKQRNKVLDALGQTDEGVLKRVARLSKEPR